MSRLLHLLNHLKAEARVDLLTSSQQAVMTAILIHWKMPERVNLVGARGVGKTFLGWVLAREHDAKFVSSPKQLSSHDLAAGSRVVVDNVPTGERQLRALLAELQLQETRTALLISGDTNQVGLPMVELGLPTTEDIHVVYHNLSMLEYYSLEPRTQGSLWQVIYSTLTISHRRGAK